MSNKLVWVHSFPSDCLAETNGMKAFQIATYVTLKWHMHKNGAPIFYDQDKLAHSAGCSKKIFNKALEFLIRDKKIICLEDGRLWSLDVEEELADCQEKLDKSLEKSAKASQSAKVRWENSKDKNDAYADSMRNDANHNHIYNKKSKTIVLDKKEIDEDFYQNTDQVLELVSEQSEISSENLPPIHEQKNVLKKTKQSKAHRGGRLPADFEPDFDFAIKEGLPPERVKVEIAKFRDYWSSKSGANATKLDWLTTH
ncbi:DUF1376 domain-containing protein [Bartonella rattaustraliani]|uniref:DUF1376 domain-containing protein n=1 Tax=Bartonella rattaustraliani TaxID=481139 RepID=UPI00036A971A|nr:DUF1376 domain-containing protein [Bartonella rattaustraliani]